MTKGWGAAAGIMLAVATMLTGCSSDDQAKPKASKPTAPSLEETEQKFREIVATDSCESTERGTCYEAMTVVVEAARDLRKAMNAEKSVGPEFWTDAYAMMETMEKGYAVGYDLGGGVNMHDMLTNRDDVFGTSHDLVEWLDAHPIA